MPAKTPPFPTRGSRAARTHRDNPSRAHRQRREILVAAVAIKSPPPRDKAIAEFAWNALETDPELDWEALLQLSTGGAEKFRLLQHYAMRLAEQNPDEALTWASSLGTDEEVAAARGQIALIIAETDSERAGNLLSEFGIAGRTFDVATVQVIQRWATQSPANAAAWVALFPQGAAREAGIKIITRAIGWRATHQLPSAGWIPCKKKDSARKPISPVKLMAIKSDAKVQEIDAKVQ